MLHVNYLTSSIFSLSSVQFMDIFINLIFETNLHWLYMPVLGFKKSIILSVNTANCLHNKLITLHTGEMVEELRSARPDYQRSEYMYVNF